MPPTAGQLFRLARVLRDVALAAAASPEERPVSLGVVLIADDIAQHEHTSIGEIAQRTGLAQSLVSKTVAHLRDAGVVETDTDADDRRRTRVRVTDSARSTLFAERGGRTVTAALRDVLPDLGAEQVAELEKRLEELVTAFRGFATDRPRT